jgi:pyridoxamine 5'-phosphate oxidase
MQNLADLRQTYAKGKLSLSEVSIDPFKQFEIWFEQASSSQCPEPHAMSLATVDAEGNPSARMVLLKGIIDQQFVFYTNYLSQKGLAIQGNPKVALLFFWHDLERQVRIEGVCQMLAPELSDAYYYSRPLGSRLGAHASPQSQIIPNREFLEAQEEAIAAQFGENPPRPKNWGGYAVIPHRIEFWQGRPSRLHDRINYRKANDSWLIERLAP